MNSFVRNARYIAAGLTFCVGLTAAYGFTTLKTDPVAPTPTVAAPENTETAFIASTPLNAITGGAYQYVDTHDTAPVPGVINAELTSAVQKAVLSLSQLDEKSDNSAAFDSANKLVRLLNSEPLVVSAALSNNAQPDLATSNKSVADSNKTAETKSSQSKEEREQNSAGTGVSGTEVSGKESSSKGNSGKAASTKETPASDSPTSDTPNSDTPSSDAPTSKARTTEKSKSASKDTKSDSNKLDIPAIGTAISASDLPLAEQQKGLAEQILASLDSMEADQQEWLLSQISVDENLISSDVVLYAAIHQWDNNFENHSNGKIPEELLCTMRSGTNEKARCDAAAAFSLLNQAYKKEFGTDIGITDSYRSYSSQVRVKALKGFLAATPGYSNHGWGVALDLNGPIAKFDTTQRNWMLENGPKFGWISPSWAHKTGSKPEPWHFEFEGVPDPDFDEATWELITTVDSKEINQKLEAFKLTQPKLPTP